MSLFADLLSSIFDRRFKAFRSDDLNGKTLEELSSSLVGSTGEVSLLNTAQTILSRYRDLDDAGKLAFFYHLVNAMNIDPEQVRTAVGAYERAPSKETYRQFMSAAEPDRQEMIRRLNRVPGGTEELVRMRADLLRLGKGDPQLEALDLDLQHLFLSWFNRGFLVLRPINWESPALILEKIIAYEAVHAIDSWDALRHRLEPDDRRCFAFFHPSMPDEPLIFVEVALTKGIPQSIQSLLDEEREQITADEADTAVFYSISNCQAGLANISFGNSLIKQVVADLSGELSGLKTFVTLSPIPGLSRWHKTADLAPELDLQDPAHVRALAAHYLLHAKGRGELPFDPVARFHLGNGAQVHAIHAEADTSPKGQAQSFGAMVNYFYDMKTVTQNHEAFAAKGEVKASGDVKSLASSATKQFIKEKQADDKPTL